jgi:divalent metal cation (Fe/Co/Zn/Cd) transporter
MPEVTDARTNLQSSEQVALIRCVLLLSWLTVAWLAVDGTIGMTAGIAANSVALIGWGLDCAIEAAASLAIIWRFTGRRSHSVDAERRTQAIVALSFFLLVPYIIVEALDHLLTGNSAKGSWIGIALAAIDAALMPLLGQAKKRVGARLGSPATTSAGVQNLLCAYLSIAVLIGLLANAALGLWWADPIVALVVALVCLQAGVRAWRGDSCEQEIAR